MCRYYNDETIVSNIFKSFNLKFLSGKMSIIDSLKKAFHAITNPSSNTEEMSIGNALKFYYSAAIIPFIIALVLGTGLAFVASSLIKGTFSFIPGLAAVGAGFTGIVVMLVLTAGLIIYLFILIPIMALIVAALVQFFSKNLFKFWNGGYNKTFTAMLFAQLPIVLFIWASFIPFVTILLAIWGFIVGLITLAKQQQVSIGKAFVALIVTGIMLLVILFIIILLSHAIF